MEDDDWVLVSSPSAPTTQPDPNTTPEYLDDISAFVDDLADALWPVNKTIHDHPELGFKEKIAAEALTSFLKTRPGWSVKLNVYGMETAWVAVWDSGKKGTVVSFNAEMDALPEIGHACGHNLIATASVSGALAAAATMEKNQLPGKVVLFGTPAEEGGGGKIKLIKAGAYTDYKVDFNLISHPGITPDSALMTTTAYTRLKVEYFGRESHAAANPWLGINALDALITAYNALSVLRQQTQPADIIQGHITSGGLAPNIIHAYAAGTFVIRAASAACLAVLLSKVQSCFAAGATATGARLALTRQNSYADHRPNAVLASLYRMRFNALGGAVPAPAVDAVQGHSNASTDQGDVSYALPSLSAGFWIRPGAQRNGPHSPDFEGAAGTREAFALALRVGKALAGTAVGVVCGEGGGREAVWREWRRDVLGEEGV
ncbi:hypothetical protein IWX90DRAFT_390348 [Phyllosticta citrichinensis]|uniref:Peptidase M20 domain-containing protein 2 n=1 Tax=Phyllosticta citrichinensis TaxID=1130410 RepID=A0ABR1XL08_9PEZI